MAGLIDLPVEIIDNVCQYLRQLFSNRYDTGYTPAARKGLASLFRTSKKFHTIAVRHLYHHVNINDEEVRLVPFTRTLFQNQQLADLVHEIDFEQCRLLSTDPILYSHFLRQPVTMPKRTIHRITWVTDGSIDPEIYSAERVLELLPIALRKLRSVDLIAHDDYFADEVFTLIKDKHLHDPDFRKSFKEITLRCTRRREGTVLDSLIPLISATSIQKLTLWDCVEMTNFGSCKLPSLLEVRILNSALTFYDFITLVEWCPNLELLRYELGADFADEIGPDLATSSEISKAIAPLNQSLKTLIVYQNWADVFEMDGIEPLTNFSKLQNLVISFHDLTGEYPDSDVEDSETEDCSSTDDDVDLEGTKWRYRHSLPKSLENLCIVDAHNSLVDELSRLGKSAKNHFPYLKSLIVDKSFDLRALFADSDINYQEVDHDSIMESDLGLEEFFQRCLQQLDRERGNPSQRDITFNKVYTKSILPYYIRLANPPAQ